MVGKYHNMKTYVLAITAQFVKKKRESKNIITVI